MLRTSHYPGTDGAPRLDSLDAHSPNTKAHSSKRSVRVLFVIPGLADGLGMIHAKKLVKALEREGLDSRTLFLHPGLNPVRLFRHTRDFLSSVRGWKPDVVYGHFGGKTALMTIALSRLCEAKSLIHYRGSDLNPVPSDGHLRPSLMHFASQVCNLLADYRIFVSRQLRSRIWFSSVLTSPHSVLPSGYDSTVFYTIPRKQARQSLGISIDDKVLAFVAGHSPAVKGADLVNRVVDTIRRSTTLRFITVANDWPPTQLALLFNAADCLIFASQYEGSPCVVQEALACGCPLVTVDVGDISDLTRGAAGVDIVSRTVASLTSAVLARLSQPTRISTPASINAAQFQVLAKEIMSILLRLSPCNDI